MAASGRHLCYFFDASWDRLIIQPSQCTLVALGGAVAGLVRGSAGVLLLPLLLLAWRFWHL